MYVQFTSCVYRGSMLILKCLIRLPNTMNEVNEMVLKFDLADGFLQCLGAVDGSHVNVKKTLKETQMIT